MWTLQRCVIVVGYHCRLADMQARCSLRTPRSCNAIVIQHQVLALNSTVLKVAQPYEIQCMTEENKR